MDFCDWSEYKKWLEAINNNTTNINNLENKNLRNKIEVYRTFMHAYPVGSVVEFNSNSYRIMSYELISVEGQPATYNAVIRDEDDLDTKYDLLELINLVANATSMLLSTYLARYMELKNASEEAIYNEMNSLKVFTGYFKTQYPVNSVITFVYGVDDEGAPIVKAADILKYTESVISLHIRGTVDITTGRMADLNEEFKDYVSVDLYQRITAAVDTDFDATALATTHLIVGEGEGDKGIQYRLIVKDKQLGIKKLA